MKNNVFNLLITSVCLLVISTAVAQPIRKAAKVEKVTTIRNRKLVVLLKPEDDAEMKKLNASELKNYRQDISKLNADLEFVIKNFWTFNESITYLMSDKLSSLNDQIDQYAVIALDLLNVRYVNQLTRKPANQLVRLHVGLLEEYDPLKPVFYQDIAGLVSGQSVPTVSKMDLIPATHMIQNHLEAIAAGKKRRNGLFFEEVLEHAGTLKSKTLLIDTTFMDNKLKESDIKNHYLFSFEISNEKVIEAAQIRKDSKYAYVYLFPATAAENVFYHCIMDCQSGKVISYSLQGGFHQNNLIDQKHLKEYVLYSDYYNYKKKDR